MHGILEVVRGALGLGLESRDLGAGQMALRGVVVFVAGILLVRVASRRFMGRSTAFDVMLGFMFGSMLSRAITGNAPFVPVLVTALVLVLLHWIFSSLSYHSRPLGILLKGRPRTLVERGRIRWDEMRRNHTTEHDLYEAIRQNRGLTDLEQVEEAVLERSGEISVVQRREEEKGTAGSG